MAASILTDKLTKYYPGSKLPALDQLSLQIPPGEIYGFLGANGAGKSTTIRLLLNFLRPTDGSARILDQDSVHDSVAIKRHVGYLAGDVALYSKASGRELLDYLGRLQGKVDKSYRKVLETRFEAELDKPISALSKGNRQKIGVLQAMMHRPEVLILDEPTSGLDPLMQEAFYDSLKEAKQRGTAVLMSSHNLAEAQRVCDRIGIIKHGKLIREQSITDDLELGKTIFRVTFANPTSLHQLQSASHIKVLSQSGSNTAVIEPTGSIAAALKVLSQYEIRSLATEQLNLEDEFMEFYGDNQ